MVDVKQRMQELAISFDYYMNNYSQYMQEYSTLKEKNEEDTIEAKEIATKAQISLTIINAIQDQIKDLTKKIQKIEQENNLEPTISEIDETEEPELGGR